jgi:glycosyltransferase involved in cell wall biosynthesis
MKRVSVLMPMRDAQRYVRPALASVLSQPGVDLEVVVIDDGSTDNSADIVRQLGDPRVRMIAGPCGGISVALNRGLDVATGEFIARCDADDLYPANRLAWQVEFLDANPDYGAICGAYSTMTHRGQHVADLDCGRVNEEITAELRGGKTRTHLGTYLVRASAYRAVGGFRPYFVTAEDIDLQLRLAETTRICYEPRQSYVFRLHDASITYLQSDAARVFYDRTARHFQQQRQAGAGDDLDRNCPPLPPEDLVAPPSKAALQVQDMLMAASWREHRAGEKGRALGTGLRAIRARPTNLAAWRNLGSLLLKRTDDHE